MILNPSSSFLENLWLNGKAPFLKDLLKPNGDPAEWTVTMLTGWFPNLKNRPFNHRKVFTLTPSGIVGCNILFQNYKWGYFKIETSTNMNNSPSLLINYNIESNSFLTRPIKDFIRTTDNPNKLIGKFTFANKFAGFFNLTQI